MPLPDDVDLRTCLAACDDLEKKVLGGLVARCIVEPQRVRDGEWLLRTFVEVATVALAAGDTGPATTADVERVQTWVRSHRDHVLRTALRLFLRTADELRAAGSPPTLESAQAIVRRHLAGSGAP